jgi:hypothetical protein
MGRKVIGERVAKPASRAGFYFSFTLGWELFMLHTFHSIDKIIPKRAILILGACLVVGLFLTLSHSPVYAAQESTSGLASIADQESSCTPPNDWAQTTRVKNPEKPTKQWTFTVDQPEMLVSLSFFYYQDYSKAGCPYECSTGECQTDETGKGVTPLGNFNVLDGKEGANRGSKKFEGRLAQGTYQVTFTANGDPGSLNTGLNVRQNSVPTATSFPTNIPVPTDVPPTATNPPTATPLTPTATESTPPPVEKTTPTPTSKPKRTPPATLAPPTPFPGSPPPLVLIPQTGSVPGLVSGINALIFIPLGSGLIGLTIVFYGIVTRLKRK